MGNRRVIQMLLGGIAVCALLLWWAERRDVSFAESARRSSVLVEGPLDTLDRLVIEQGGLFLDVRRQKGGWEMTAPFAAHLDQGAVAQFLDTFEKARIGDAVRFSEMRRRGLELGDYGLAPPVARVTLQGGGQERTLLVGRALDQGQEVYMRALGVEEIWSAPAEVAARLPGGADDWRARDLIAGDRARLRLLEIRAPGRPFVRLSKETGTWRLLQPVDGPADDRKVEALLDTLYDGRAAQFVWPSVASAADTVTTDSALASRMALYGLGAEAALQVTAQEAAGAEPCRVVFGNRCDGEGALRYVLMPGGGAVAAVPNAVYEAFLCAPSDLRDMRLFSERPERVRRVEIAVEGLLFVLTQDDARWKMEAPVAMRMDQGRVSAAVGQLLRLTGEELGVRSEELGVRSEELGVRSCVEVQTEEGAVSVTFTRDDEEGHFYRVTMTGSAEMYQVACSNVPPAFVDGQAALDLCDRTMLSFADDAVRKVTVRRTDGTGEAVQRGVGAEAGWRPTEEARELDTDAFEPFLAKINLLVAERIERPVAAQDDPYAFGAPWLEITLDVDAADAIRKTLVIGGEASGDGRYAMIRGQDVVFVLGQESLAILEKRVVSE